MEAEWYWLADLAGGEASVADGSTVQHLRTVSACLEALVEYLDMRQCGAMGERIAGELRQVVEHIEECGD